MSKSIKEMVDVMQAFEAGSIIQIKDVDGVDYPCWTDVEHPCWNWGEYDYRVKPAPREFILYVNDLTGEVITWEDFHDMYHAYKDGFKKIRTMEIL
ncbi:hypothetical protein E6Q11_02120 [Candidatus Dojkabacteria bacterium]|uniref:Uncharacterized protein n=1 Tax=Candidatus Dojkabacteria bacterium TaxID=2099670 RepID=A0A5C7J8C9_9BACT|nr:MAG: hypothetical protein E6Q11_02120 [Candidatus Dojkabacteria bacterium]